MVAATYFDSRNASAHPVELMIEGNLLCLHGDGIELRWPLENLDISERLGNTPRRLSHSGSGHCEVVDNAALEAMLAKAGVAASRPGWLDRMQHSPRWALLSAVLFVAALLAAYRYLLPWGAQTVAMHVPASVLQKMGSSTLETLDQYLLHPSELPEARRKTLAARFAALQAAETSQMRYRLVFRRSPEIGANAFALPDGTIVMLDELVEQTGNDDEVLAVLAHERGHIERRHTARMVLQSSAVGLVVAWYMGDVSTLLTAVPAAILEAGYSRDMEREADQYAARMLQRNGLSPCLLTAMLDKLEKSHRQRPASAQPDSPKILDYLASHPPTQDRAGLLCPKH